MHNRKSARLTSPKKTELHSIIKGADGIMSHRELVLIQTKIQFYLFYDTLEMKSWSPASCLNSIGTGRNIPVYLFVVPTSYRWPQGQKAFLACNLIQVSNLQKSLYYLEKPEIYNLPFSKSNVTDTWEFDICVFMSSVNFTSLSC